MKHKMLLLLLTVAGMAHAETLSLESPGSHPAFKPAAADIRRALNLSVEDAAYCQDLSAAPVPLADQGEYYVVAGCTGGSAAAPFWLLAKQGGRYRVLLNEGSYALNILPGKHKGLRDVSFQVGNAGSCSQYVYRYDGKAYRQYKSENCLP